MTDLPKEFDELEGGDIFHYVRANVTTLSFPEKLMYMMISVEKEAAKSTTAKTPAIVWNTEGTVIVVLNSKELEDVWIPQFFGSNCKFKSFTRKLYRWGFRKFRISKMAQSSKPEMIAKWQVTLPQGCFQHRYFQRDHKKLLYQMENTTNDKTQRMREVQRSKKRPTLSFLVNSESSTPSELASGRVPIMPDNMPLACSDQDNYGSLPRHMSQQRRQLTDAPSTTQLERGGMDHLQHNHSGSACAWHIDAEQLAVPPLVARFQSAALPHSYHGLMRRSNRLASANDTTFPTTKPSIEEAKTVTEGASTREAGVSAEERFLIDLFAVDHRCSIHPSHLQAQNPGEP